VECPCAESIADVGASYFSIRPTFYKLRRAVTWRDMRPIENYHPRYPVEKLHYWNKRQHDLMLADKIRTVNNPAFRLEPRDAVYIVSFIGALAYILGFLVGRGI